MRQQTVSAAAAYCTSGWVNKVFVIYDLYSRHATCHISSSLSTSRSVLLCDRYSPAIILQYLSKLREFLSQGYQPSKLYFDILRLQIKTLLKVFPFPLIESLQNYNLDKICKIRLKWDLVEDSFHTGTFRYVLTVWHSNMIRPLNQV